MDGGGGGGRLCVDLWRFAKVRKEAPPRRHVCCHLSPLLRSLFPGVSYVSLAEAEAAQNAWRWEFSAMTTRKALMCAGGLMLPELAEPEPRHSAFCRSNNRRRLQLCSNWGQERGKKEKKKEAFLPPSLPPSITASPRAAALFSFHPAKQNKYIHDLKHTHRHTHSERERDRTKIIQSGLRPVIGC